MPERLRMSGVVTRDPGRADALTTDWDVPAFGTFGDLPNLCRSYIRFGSVACGCVLAPVAPVERVWAMRPVGTR